MLTGSTRVRPMVAAGTGVIRGGLRGTPSIQSLEQSVPNSSRPLSALTAKPTAAVVVPRPAINADDCQFTDELVMEAGEPVPRIVFGGVPNFQEAKEATAELKEALDEMYLSSPKFSETETSFVPGISLPLSTDIEVNRSGVMMEKKTSNPGHEHVLQSFRLLSYNTEVQTIVASLASDPNVCSAVLENPEVKQFILANQTSSDTLEDEANVTQVGKSGAGFIEKLRNVKDLVIKMVINVPIHLPNLFGSSATETASESDHKGNTQSSPIDCMKDGKSGSSFVGKLRNLKNSVVKMATNIPNYLPNLYKSSAAESESVSGSDHKGNTQSSPMDWSLGTSLIGLAIMVIMIVLFKRV